MRRALALSLILVFGCDVSGDPLFLNVADKGHIITPGQILRRPLEGIVSQCFCAGGTGQLACTSVAGQTVISFNKVVPSLEGTVATGAKTRFSVPGLSELLGSNSAEVELQLSGSFQGRGLDWTTEWQDPVVNAREEFEGGNVILKAPSFQGTLVLSFSLTASGNATPGLVMVGADAKGQITRTYQIQHKFADAVVPLRGDVEQANRDLQKALRALAETAAASSSQNPHRSVAERSRPQRRRGEHRWPRQHSDRLARQNPRATEQNARVLSRSSPPASRPSTEC